MKTTSGIVMKLINAGPRGVIAKLITGEEIRVSHRDYWRHLEQCANMPEGYEGVPYLNQYHLITVPNPKYNMDEE